MSWRIATRHVSTYRYRAPVFASYNEVRMTPVASDRQLVLDSQIAVRPVASLYRYVDYWGSVVHAFDVHEAHEELTVTGSSLVETASAIALNSDATWADVHRAGVQDRFAELLAATSYVPGNKALTELARELGDRQGPAGAVEAISSWVRSSMRYEPGTTQVSTSAVEAWHQASGVCQDFAHLSLVLLRALGLPARYVSGYLYPDAAGSIGQTVMGASHAWVEVWLGGFQAVDPTNGKPVGEQHVRVASGRDYRDVAPFVGVYHGGSLGGLGVSVELSRVA